MQLHQLCTLPTAVSYGTCDQYYTPSLAFDPSGGELYVSLVNRTTQIMRLDQWTCALTLHALVPESANCMQMLRFTFDAFGSLYVPCLDGLYRSSLPSDPTHLSLW